MRNGVNKLVIVGMVSYLIFLDEINTFSSEDDDWAQVIHKC